MISVDIVLGNTIKMGDTQKKQCHPFFIVHKR